MRGGVLEQVRGRAGHLFSRAEMQRTGEQWISVACTIKRPLLCVQITWVNFCKKQENKSNTILFFLFASPLQIGHEATLIASRSSKFIT